MKSTLLELMSGRGPVIGPLVVSALRIPNMDVKLLEEIGVKDSKK